MCGYKCADTKCADTRTRLDFRLPLRPAILHRDPDRSGRRRLEPTDLTRPTVPTGGRITIVGGPSGGVAGPSDGPPEGRPRSPSRRRYAPSHRPDARSMTNRTPGPPSSPAEWPRFPSRTSWPASSASLCRIRPGVERRVVESHQLRRRGKAWNSPGGVAPGEPAPARGPARASPTRSRGTGRPSARRGGPFDTRYPGELERREDGAAFFRRHDDSPGAPRESRWSRPGSRFIPPPSHEAAMPSNRLPAVLAADVRWTPGPPCRRLVSATRGRAHESRECRP